MVCYGISGVVNYSCLVPRRLSPARKGRRVVCALPMVPWGSSPVACLYLAKNEAAEEVRFWGGGCYYLKTRQLLVPVPPEYWIFKMASPCYFLVLPRGLALFAVSRCYSGSISNFLIFRLPVDHSWQRDREEKSWRGLKTNKKGSAYCQEKDWYLCIKMWVS